MKTCFILFILLIPFALNAQWVQTNGPAGGNICSLEIINNNIYAGSLGNGMFISTDRGNIWINSSNGFTSKYAQAIISLDSILVVGTNDKGILISKDQGGSWESRNNGLTQTNIYSLAKDGNDILAGTENGGLFISTNKGVLWNRITVQVEVVKQTGIYTIFKKNELLIVGTGGNGVLRSTNAGLTWEYCDTYLSNYDYVYSIISNGNILFAGSWDGLWVSSDNGVSWQQMDSGIHLKIIMNLLSIGNKVFVGTKTAGVFLTTNNGLSWTPVNEGLKSLDVYSLASDNDYLYAATYSGGVWKRSLSEIITDVKRTSELPYSYSLSQNYPNPFNPNTTINYKVQATCPVTLKVYDLLGREVAMLVDEVKQPGSYNSTFSIMNYTLPSGVYFYTLRAGDFIQTKKMVLMK